MTYAVIGGVLLLVFLGLYLMVKGRIRIAEKTGEDRVIKETQEKAIGDVLEAKQVDEALRTNSDPDWAQRVRTKYRRD